MDISIQLTPHVITGSNQPHQGKFSKVFIYRPPAEPVHQARGELFSLISFSSPDPSLDLEVLAKQCWDALQQQYFSNLIGSPSSALQESLQKTQIHLHSLIVSPQSGQEKILDFNLLSVVVWGKAYFAARLGQNHLWLFRNQGLQNILPENFSSGEILDHDLLILTTPAVFENLGESQITEILAQNNFEESVAILKEEVLQKSEPAAYSLLLIESKQTLVPSEEEIIEIVDIDAKESQALRNLFGPLSSRIKAQLTTLPRLNFDLPFLKRYKAASSDLYVKRPEEQKDNRRLLVLGGLILVFAVSIFTTHWFKEREKKLQLSQNLLSSAEEKINESRQIADLNPQRAKKLLDEAADELGKVQGATKVQSLQEEIDKTLSANYKIEKLDLKVSSEMWPQEIYDFDPTQEVLDPQGKVLLEKSADWQKVIGVEQYLGNLYLLDTGVSQIHKYIGLPQGFSKRFDYFKRAVDLSGAIDFAIDGNIYILFQDGHLEKYLGGERVEFALSGFYPPLDKITGLFTSVDNELLYLFGQNQILIFDKEGSYQKGFEFNLPEADQEINKVYVNEGEKTLWLKTNQNIFKASY